MSLEKTISLIDNLGQEITFSRAYHRVRVAYEASSKMLHPAVEIFSLKGGALIDVRSAPAFLADFSGSAPNFIAQAYAHLKTLPEFAGAVDC